jgi:hypothetical protein
MRHSQSVARTRLALLLCAITVPGLTWAQVPWYEPTRTAAPKGRDSLRVADQALQTFLRAEQALGAHSEAPDTLVCYRVSQFTRDSAGVIVVLLPELLPRYSQLAMVGGGGKVRVVRPDSAIVVEWYR